MEEDLVGLDVALAIITNFPGPVVGVGDGNCVVFWAAVPETAIEEYSDLGTCEDNISGAANTWQGTRGNAVAKAKAVHCLPQRQFGAGISGPVGLHASPYPRGRGPRLASCLHPAHCRTAPRHAISLRQVSSSMDRTVRPMCSASRHGTALPIWSDIDSTPPRSVAPGGKL